MVNKDWKEVIQEPRVDFTCSNPLFKRLMDEGYIPRGIMLRQGEINGNPLSYAVVDSEKGVIYANFVDGVNIGDLLRMTMHCASVNGFVLEVLAVNGDSQAEHFDPARRRFIRFDWHNREFFRKHHEIRYG